MSGFTDDSPPFVESIVPLPNAKGRTEKIAPNALIQITFSEPIDPTTVKNSVIDVRNTGTASPIPGTASIGNNFRTVIFTPSEQCGSNACSEPMFCLPKAASLSVKLRAAKISSDKSIGPNKAVFPMTGSSMLPEIRSTAEGKTELRITPNLKGVQQMITAQVLPRQMRLTLRPRRSTRSILGAI